MLLTRKHSAPRDLQRHPHGFRSRRLDHLLCDVADDTDVLIRQVRVLAGRIPDRVDVGTRNVEGGPVAHQVVHRAERCLSDHDRMVGVQLLQAVVRAGKAGGGDRGRAVRVRRLVNALPSAQSGVIFEAVDDPDEELLHWRVRRRRKIRRGLR